MSFPIVIAYGWEKNISTRQVAQLLLGVDLKTILVLWIDSVVNVVSLSEKVTCFAGAAVSSLQRIAMFQQV